jgi:glutathione S-transferase
LTEGPAIVPYVAEQEPGSGLAPANGTLDRYRLVARAGVKAALVAEGLLAA